MHIGQWSEWERESGECQRIEGRGENGRESTLTASENFPVECIECLDRLDGECGGPALVS